MRGSGNDIARMERTFNHARCHETADMSHITQQIGTTLVRDLPHAIIIDCSAVSRRSSDDNLWSENLSGLFQSIVVNNTSLWVQMVWHSCKILGDKRDMLRRDLVTMRQMSAVWKIETHQTVVSLHNSAVGVEIGGGAG